MLGPCRAQCAGGGEVGCQYQQCANAARAGAPIAIGCCDGNGVQSHQRGRAGQNSSARKRQARRQAAASEAECRRTDAAALAEALTERVADVAGHHAWIRHRDGLAGRGEAPRAGVGRAQAVGRVAGERIAGVGRQAGEADGESPGGACAGDVGDTRAADVRTAVDGGQRPHHAARGDGEIAVAGDIAGQCRSGGSEADATNACGGKGGSGRRYQDDGRGAGDAIGKHRRQCIAGSKPAHRHGRKRSRRPVRGRIGRQEGGQFIRQTLKSHHRIVAGGTLGSTARSFGDAGKDRSGQSQTGTGNGRGGRGNHRL